MKTLSKILPIIAATLWAVCLGISIVIENANYRTMFIIAAATLIIINLAIWIGDRCYERDSKGSDNKS